MRYEDFYRRLDQLLYESYASLRADIANYESMSLLKLQGIAEAVQKIPRPIPKDNVGCVDLILGTALNELVKVRDETWTRAFDGGQVTDYVAQQFARAAENVTNSYRRRFRAP